MPTDAIAGDALGGFAGSLVGAGVSVVSALAVEKHLAEGNAIIVIADAAWSEKIADAARRSRELIGIHHA